jgi:hypothetical protein
LIDIDIISLSSILMPQTPKKLKRFKKSLTGRRERASERQTTTVTRLYEQYSQRERQNNLIYN